MAMEEEKWEFSSDLEDTLELLFAENIARRGATRI
jgi:hypothetical protein